MIFSSKIVEQRSHAIFRLHFERFGLEHWAVLSALPCPDNKEDPSILLSLIFCWILPSSVVYIDKWAANSCLVGYSSRVLKRMGVLSNRQPGETVIFRSKLDCRDLYKVTIKLYEHVKIVSVIKIL